MPSRKFPKKFFRKFRKQYFRKLAKQYLDDALIIPLLDGLDELVADRQESCIQAINQFLQPRSWKNPLVVCSRIKEYELLENKLGLKGSIILQSLNDEQIEQYLEQTKTEQLKEIIQTNQGWSDLAKTPLFLDIMVLASQEISSEAWQSLVIEEEKLDYLFEAYLNNMLNPQRLVNIYQQELQNSSKKQQKKLRNYLKYAKNLKQTRHYLTWIARQLKQNNQTEFLIEKLQPSDLRNKKQRLIYGLIVGLIFGLILGLIVGLILGLIVGLILGLIVGLILGLIVGLILGLIVGLRYDNSIETPQLSWSSLIVWLIYLLGTGRIETVETLQFSWSNLRKAMILGLTFGLVVGLIFGLIGGLIFGLIGGLICGLIGGLIYGLMVGLIYGLIGGLIKGLSVGELEIKRSPNQGIKASMYNNVITWGIGIILGGGLYLSLWMASGWLNQVDEQLHISLRGGLIAAILIIPIWSDSGEPVLKHFSLRLVLTAYGYTPWNLAQVLNYSTHRLILQRVGGGYRFIHRLLQDHLAKQDYAQK